MKNAIIFFTKAPIPGFCKTRLAYFMGDDNASNLQKFLIEKNLKILNTINAKIFIYLDGNFEFKDYEVKKQSGKNIGKKMSNAFNDILSIGYEKVILIGSDLSDLRPEILNLSFEILDFKDVVISPSDDGGYSLIGLKKPNKSIFNLEKFSSKFVFDKTICAVQKENLSYEITPKISDIDTINDIADFIVGCKTNFLAKGEYNANFSYCKNGIKKILRIKRDSQINVENPSLYEYNALKFLEPLDITPKVYDFFDKSVFLPLGGFSMEFLDGKVLNYETDLKIAANLLSKLHSFDTNGSNLIVAKKPFLEMFQECLKMSSIYESFDGAKSDVLDMLEIFKITLKTMGLEDDISSKNIINTELNNSNFIIGKKSYIIDWEKPLIGDKEQDLAHFLVPTTTFFKSDVVLKKEQMDVFLNEYAKSVSFSEKLFNKYYKFTLFRGFSWCCMAYVNNTKKQKSPAYEKIKFYLGKEFIRNLKRWLAS